jgi:hypothetical protein
MSDSAHVAAPFEVAATYGTEREARDAAATLLLKGMGAATEPADDGDGFCVMVVPGHAAHAAEILGVRAEPVAEPEPAGRSQVVPVLLIFGAAMIILPLIAFFVSFKLSGG